MRLRNLARHLLLSCLVFYPQFVWVVVFSKDISYLRLAEQSINTNKYLRKGMGSTKCTV